MPYAVCETLDEHASILQGPAVVLTEEEMSGVMMAVELMQRTRTYPVSDLLLTVLAKLHYLTNREKQ